MSDIKKKFLDILFEPEDEEIQADAPLNDISKNTFHVKLDSKTNATRKEDYAFTKTIPNARDLLYGKNEHKSSSFIDYYEVPKKEKPVDKVIKDEYELRENVSPIFGPIASKDKKKKAVAEKEIQKAVTSSTSNNEYTSVIISPIYGYDANKANDARRNLYDVKEQIYEEIERDDLEPAFDMYDNGTSEAIQEAVEEAVIELAPSKRIKKQYTKKSKQTTKKETHEDEEPDLNITGEYVYEPIDELEPFINKENDEDNVADDTMSDVFDSFDAYEDEPASLSEEELSIDEAADSIQKATRSIYDTTPVQLFDFDDINDSDNTSSDLFNGIVEEED